MAFSRRALLLLSAGVLSSVGLMTSPAAATTDITIDQGESVRIRVPGVDRITPARIRWGDGSVSNVRTTCRPAKARRHPLACIAMGVHSYTRTGAFTVSSIRKGRTKVIATVVVTAPKGEPDTSPSDSPSETGAEWRHSMLEMINDIRHAAGVEPLRICAALERSAQAYAQTMADHKFFDHNGRDGSTPGSRAEAAGYDWASVGENIAYGQESVTQVITAFRGSPGHYANLVDPSYTDVGFGRASNPANPNSPLWTQDFGAGGTC